MTLAYLAVFNMPSLACIRDLKTTAFETTGIPCDGNGKAIFYACTETKKGVSALDVILRKSRDVILGDKCFPPSYLSTHHQSEGSVALLGNPALGLWSRP